MRLVRLCLTVSCAVTACAGRVPSQDRNDGGLVSPGGIPSDAGLLPDAGSVDSRGTRWRCPDGGTGGPDAGPADGGAIPQHDAGAPDAGLPSPPDGGRPDAGPPPDAGVPDAGTPVDLGETTWKSLLDPSLSRFYRWLPSKGRNRDPEGVFRMEGDVLHILGLPTSGEAKDFGYLATWDQFHDYRLRLEQKWGTQTFPPRKNQPRDSGLLYHLLLPDSDLAHVRGVPDHGAQHRGHVDALRHRADHHGRGRARLTPEVDPLGQEVALREEPLKSRSPSR